MSVAPCFFLNLSATEATFVESLVVLAGSSTDTFPDEILIRLDFKTFLYHCFREPLSGIGKTAFTCAADDTDVEISPADCLSLTVVWISPEASELSWM